VHARVLSERQCNLLSASVASKLNEVMSSTDHYARIVPLHKARNRNNDISRPEDEQFNANRNSIDKVLESATQHVFAQVVDYLKQQESKTTLESG
jgi:hypothetical protein